ncbi:MAG: DUF6502 family protein [Thiobacillaceae bacterium]
MCSFAPASSPLTPPQPLIAAVRRVLRPLVRLLLSYSVTYPHFAALLKAAYVDVALQGFALEGKAQSDSRITLLTGIHRQDVKRLRAELEFDAWPSPTASLGAQLVGKWLGQPQYLDSTGQPKPLARHASEGGDLSFERLVQSISKDFRPRVVLDEWLRRGIANLNKDGHVELVGHAFTPSEAQAEDLFRFGTRIHDHLAASTHNILLNSHPPMLDRAMSYEGLSADSALRLESEARMLATRAMEQLEAAARTLREADAGRDDATYRVSFGAYFYQGEEVTRRDLAPQI